MARATGSPVSTTDWQANNLRELRDIWEGLHLESDEVNTARTFRGHMLTPDQAGDVFERWVTEAFRLSGATGHPAFRVPLQGSGATREQIDGLVFDGWRAFLVECKCWTGKVDFGPIAQFHAALDTRLTGTYGLFFSAFGYTLPSLESAALLRPARILLFDQWDLTWAMSSRSFKGRMVEMVRRKWMLAIRWSRMDVSVSESLEAFN